MAAHIFRRSNGSYFSLDLSFAESEAARIVGTRYRIRNQDVTRDIAMELRLAGRPKAQQRRELARYPIRSNSLGVTKHRAKELREHLKKKTGLTCVDDSGRVIFTSDVERRRIARAIGMVSTESFLD